jgi:hypothetical protein
VGSAHADDEWFDRDHPPVELGRERLNPPSRRSRRRYRLRQPRSPVGGARELLVLGDRHEVGELSEVHKETLREI